VSRLEQLEWRLQRLEAELGFPDYVPAGENPYLPQEYADRLKAMEEAAPAPAHDFLCGNHDWRSDPDLYTPGLRWRKLL
jgi:hypothetical protein